MKLTNKKKSIIILLLYTFFANYSLFAQNDACKAIIKVGITGFFAEKPNDKAKRHSDQGIVNAMTSNLVEALSKGTKVKATPLTDFSLERDFIEKAANGSYADLLLFMQMKTKVDNHYLVNIGCGVGVGRPCMAPTFGFTMNYKVIDAANGQVLKNGLASGKNDKPMLAAEEVANKLNEDVGNIARVETLDTISVERLKRKQACTSQFPTNPNALLLDYDIRTPTKITSYKYRLQDGLWRIDTATGVKKYSMGFNGEVVWDSDGKKFSQTPVKSGLEFFLGDFLTETGIEDLNNRIMSSKVLKATENINGMECYVIESETSANTFFKTYYDIKTGNILKKARLDQSRNMVDELTFENYKNVGNNVVFPLKINSKGKTDNFTIIFKQENGVVINPNLDRSIFLSFK